MRIEPGWDRKPWAVKTWGERALWLVTWAVCGVLIVGVVAVSFALRTFRWGPQ